MNKTLLQGRAGVVVSSRFDEQRVRTAHNGHPVMNADSQRIGWVTACAVDSERFLTGQAFVESIDRPATSAKLVSRFAKL